MNEPLKIPLSTIRALPFDFGGEVDAYIKRLTEHRHTVGEAAPTAPHTLVEAAVARHQHPIEAKKPDDFLAHFEVVDDTPPPPPPPTLDEKKQMLVREVNAEAEKARATIIPMLKAAHWENQYRDAMAVEQKKQTAAQKAIVSQHDMRLKKIDAINRHVAKQYSDIHDLTESTIADWKLEAFPT